MAEGEVKSESLEYVLVVVKGTEKTAYPLSKKHANTIGRNRLGTATSDMTIQLLNPTVSRKHCSIEWSPSSNGFILRDNASLPGTLLNDQRIIEAGLRDGDLIVVGTVILQFLPHAEVPPDFPPLNTVDSFRIAADWWDEHGEPERAEACRLWTQFEHLIGTQ